MLPSLPTDLVNAILDCAYYNREGNVDYHLLARCALVCTTWSLPAQSRLFRKTTKLESHTVALFHAALLTSTARQDPNPGIGHAVRTLDIIVGGQNHACTLDTLIHILQACPALYELSLTISALHELDPFVLARLKHAGQRLRALHLQYCGVQSPLVFQLLGIWPRIRFLKIGTEIAAWPWRNQGQTPVVRTRTPIGAGTRADDPHPAQPPSHVALYDLALARIPQPAVLAWLLGSSTSTLAILDLRETPGHAARDTLAVHAPHLRSLRLLHFNLDAAALLRQCTRLEELVVYTIPVIVPLAPELPHTIQHVSFRNPSHTYRHTLRPILDAIGVLPNLRIVTSDKNSERLPEFARLTKTCTERGIDVVITEIPFWVYEDPVVVTRFPRRRSVSNFGLMQ